MNIRKKISVYLESKGLSSWIDRKRFFTMKNRLNFYRRMTSLLENGARPIDAINSMLDVFSQEKSDNSEKRLLSRVRDVFRRSNSIEKALADYIPSNEILLISSGLKQNQASLGFNLAWGMTERMGRLKEEAASTLMYPIVLYCVSIFVFVGGHLLFNTFNSIPLENLPLYAQRFYNVGGVIIDYYGWFIAALVTVLLSLWYLVVSVPVSDFWYRAYQYWRPKADRVVPFNIYKLLASYSFLEALSGQIKSGIPTKEALINIQSRASAYINDHIEGMLITLSNQSPGQAITSTGLLDIDQKMSILIISKTTSFPEAVNEAAVISYKLAAVNLKRSVRVIAGGGWIASGVAIAWGALSLVSISTALM